MKLNKKLAQIFSFIGHPVIIPTVATLLYYYLEPNSSHDVSLKHVLPIILVNTLLFPLITVLILKGLGWVDSIYLRDQKERIIPLIANMMYFFWAFYTARNLHFPTSIIVMLLSGFLSLILLVFVGTAMKPSMHMNGWGIFTTWAVFVNLTNDWNAPLLIVYTIIGSAIVFVSRYALHAHSKRELWIGYFTGISSFILASWILKILPVIPDHTSES